MVCMYIAWLLDNPNFPISDLNVQFDPVTYAVTEGDQISIRAVLSTVAAFDATIDITTTGSAIREYIC